MRGKDLLECMEHIDDVLIEEASNPVMVLRRNKFVFKWGVAAACLIVTGASIAVLWSNQDSRINDSGGADTELASSMAVASSGGDSIHNAGTEEHNSPFTESLAGSAQTAGTADNDLGEKELSETVDAVPEKAIADFQASGRIDKEDKQAAVQEAIKLNHTIISDYLAADDVSSCYAVPQKGKTLYYPRLQEAIRYYGAQGKDADNGGLNYAYTVVIDVFGDISTESGEHYEHLNLTDAGNARIEQEYRRLLELGYSVSLSEDFLFMGTFTEEELDTFDAHPEYGYVFRFEQEG